MSEDASIRRENLKKLKLGPNDLVARVGGTYSYWRDLLSNEKKSFGEKAARNIEEKLALPRGSLDQADSEQIPSNMELLSWPFPNIPPKKLTELTLTERLKIEEVVLFALFKLHTRGTEDGAPLLFIPSPGQPVIQPEGQPNGKITPLPKKGKTRHR